MFSAGGGGATVAARLRAEAEAVAQLRHPNVVQIYNPTGDGPPAASQESPEEKHREPGCGPAVEGGGKPGEPLARGGERMRGCH